MTNLEIYLFMAPLILAAIGWAAYGVVVIIDRKHSSAKQPDSR
jgi:hypothetical protein